MKYLFGLSDDRVDYVSVIAFEAADDLDLAHTIIDWLASVPQAL